MKTLIRRLKPLRSFAAAFRCLHEIRVYSDGSAVYWVQPINGSKEQEEKTHSEITFDYAPMADFDQAVAGGELIDVVVPPHE